MQNEKILAEVINKLQNQYYQSEIEEYLKNEGVNENDFASIIDEANDSIWKSKLRHYEKKNKGLFILWLSIAIASFIVFLFALPYANLKANNTLWAVTGTALVVFFSYLAIAYNKTWKEDFIKEHESPHINFGFLVIFLIPGMIFYFILDWRFSSVSYNKLKNTQVKAVGTIISGKSISTRRFDFTDVTVQFQTKEGTTITATENVSKYDFKKFYVGQTLDIVYSKDDPTNIDLLIDKSHVQELADSEERDITHDDLIRLLSVKQEDLLAELNKIKYGWEFDEINSLWTNKKVNAAVSFGKNEISIITPETMMYAVNLKRAGFKRTDSVNSNSAVDMFSTKPKVFEKDNYVATIQKIKVQTSFVTMLTVRRK